MAQPAQALLTDLLRDVSRSFYLTVRVLPRSIRRQIGLAYLLARTTDTIADTSLVPPEQRLEALEALRQRILGTSNAPLNCGQWAAQQSSPAERALLERSEESLGLLNALSEADRQLVREVLATIISGQELDLKRFSGASISHIAPLNADEDLDDYTYRVAGCVGEFWTKICRAHVFPDAKLDTAMLLEQSVRFGKGLQLVNILRDLPGDLRQGRCYLPLSILSSVGLSPADLLQPRHESRLRPLYNGYIERAEKHLMAGWAYTNTLPWRCFRVRLACAWPILIGLQTLKGLRGANMLDPEQRVKISRRDLRGWIWRSVLYYPVPEAWRRLATLSPS